jgi:3-hydroxyisobutyrate dehydrogenase-like beta-hydroxyacid dehydrogenase
MSEAQRQQGAPVTVIGLNPRGAALARALAAAGDTVTVWDEPHHAAEACKIHGAALAPSLEAAVTAAPLVVLCVEDDEAAVRVLRQAGRRLAAWDVVNLTSGTSEHARRAAAEVAANGGGYLDGALMAHPEHVGNRDTVLVYSGSAQVFTRHELTLTHLGGATYLGADAGTAALYDVAMLNFAWATLIGFLQTATLLSTAHVKATTAAPLLTHWLSTTVADVITDYARRVDDRDYSGDEEWLELDAPLMDHLIDATRERGLNAELPELIRSLTHKGIDAGHGKDSFASLVEVMRGPGERANRQTNH